MVFSRENDADGENNADGETTPYDELPRIDDKVGDVGDYPIYTY